MENVCDASGMAGNRKRVSVRAVRTGVLVIQGVSKVTGVTDLDTAKFTHFAAWFSARVLDARASWSSRRSARFSSSKTAISRPSLLVRIELIFLSIFFCQASIDVGCGEQRTDLIEVVGIVN